jgi:hypothetical protein
MEMFLKPDGQAVCVGPELFAHEQAKTEDLKNSHAVPNVVQMLLGNSAAAAGKLTDVWGLAIGADGLVVLHRDSVQGIALDGRSLWTAPLPASPVRWGLALAGKRCMVTLAEGLLVCFGEGPG